MSWSRGFFTVLLMVTFLCLGPELRAQGGFDIVASARHAIPNPEGISFVDLLDTVMVLSGTGLTLFHDSTTLEEIAGATFPPAEAVASAGTSLYFISGTEVSEIDIVEGTQVNGFTIAVAGTVHEATVNEAESTLIYTDDAGVHGVSVSTGSPTGPDDSGPCGVQGFPIAVAHDETALDLTVACGPNGAPSEGEVYDCDPELNCQLSWNTQDLDGSIVGITYAPDGSLYVLTDTMIYRGEAVTPTEQMFFRGDCDLDALLAIADPLYLLAYLFSDGPAPGCQDACDGNDDGLIAIGDALYLLGYLFQNGPPPPMPSQCGLDPTPDSSSCEVSACP